MSERVPDPTPTELIAELRADNWNLREKLDAAEAEVLRLRTRETELSGHLAVMMRACDNWRTWPGEAVDDHEHPDWKAAARAIMERDVRPETPVEAAVRSLQEKQRRIDMMPQVELERDQLREEVLRLRTAVAEHHAQKAEDRCWEDDLKLYAAFGLPPGDNHVGNKGAMLSNCMRFISNRCAGGKWQTYAELEAERDALRTGETWLKDRLVRMFATCIRGLADAAIITQQEYTADHVLAAVEQLASETVRLRTRCERLEELNKGLESLLVCYRVGKRPSEKLLDQIGAARAALADDQAADKEVP